MCTERLVNQKKSFQKRVAEDEILLSLIDRVGPRSLSQDTAVSKGMVNRLFLSKRKKTA